MSAVPRYPVLRLSVEQYQAMRHARILGADDRVELLAGWLIETQPRNPRHRAANRRLHAALESLVLADWHVASRVAITTADSEAEADIAIVQGEVGDFRHRHPGPEDVGLVVEIADATLELDRDLKRAVYARAGIGCYWIVNLLDGQVEVLEQPIWGPRDGYRRRRVFHRGETVPVVVGGARIGEIPVEQILP